MEDKPQAAKAGRANASDVARLAGVSVSTVSRALAESPLVNAETRAIEATIAGGRLTYLAGEAGCRFLSQPQALRMAAE